MPLLLRDNIHWCDSGGRAVFLDTEADRYFCLPATANEAFLRLAASHMQPQDTQRLQVLISRGVLLENDAFAAIPQPPQIEPPARDWLDEPTQGAGLLPVLRMLAAELFAARLVRTRPFHEVLEGARRGASASRPGDRNQHGLIQAIASASAAVSYLTRVQDRCLVRALAVHAICKRNGVTSKLVFGVIAHPFAAHCWVQFGDAVLVGGCEHARLYTPIMVVE